jgi:hypothetical protein
LKNIGIYLGGIIKSNKWSDVTYGFYENDDKAI